MNEEFDRFEDYIAGEMQPAQNITGFLIKTGDTFVFRVYNSDHTFCDYDIWHHDLEVTIIDTTAVFDHIAQTLDYQP
jgi:hypothetical protein